MLSEKEVLENVDFEDDVLNIKHYFINYYQYKVPNITI